MTKEVQFEFVPLIKALSFTIKQFRLYSENHPIAVECMKTLHEEVQHYFESNEKLSLGAMRHRLIANGQMMSEKEVSANELAKEFERVALEGVVIIRGLERRELEMFMGLFSLRSKTLEDKGGFKKAFEDLKLPHVKQVSGKFKLIEDGQTVVSTDEAESAAENTGKGTGPAGGDSEKPVNSVAEIIRRIREAGPDAPGDGKEGGRGVFIPAGIPIDSESIVTQLEKSPAEVAEFAIENAKDAAQLEQMIRKIINFLIESLMSFLVEQGKDITKALDRFAKELQKAVNRLGETEELEQIKDKIPKIFEEGTDELRIQMLTRTYRENPADYGKLAKLASKLLKDVEVRNRLGPDLQEEFSDAGMNSSQIKELFLKLEEVAKPKKKKVLVDAEEFEDLRQRAENFDEELQTKLKSTVAKLEREKKIIRDEKERVESVIKNLAEGLLVVDKNGKVVLMNPAAERLLGVKQNEKLGRQVTDGLQPQHMITMAKGNLRDSEHIEKRVEIFSLNDETQKVLQASTAVIENENGQTVGMVSVLSDVTREKELSELKSRFVSNVSHELRTPLVAIQKSLSVILAKDLGELNSEQERFLSIATRNIDRLSRLINDLLDISKLESGKTTLRPKKVPIKELVIHVVATVETWAKSKNISMVTEFENEAIEIGADPDRLTQVLTNLVSNALKFTPEGGKITVDVKTGVKDSTLSPEELIEIGVRDNGIGIEPNDQEHIFDKFVQVGSAQPAGLSSTGLGLSIAREIIELHSGKIWVESERGQGSRFVFRLPVKFILSESTRLPIA